MQWYSATSRDSVRISDLQTMKTSLELYHLQVWSYPNPSNGTEVTYSWWVVWTQWTFWGSVTRNISRVNEVPVDPLTEVEYSYSVLNTKQEFELVWVLEWDLIWYNPIGSQTNAYGEKVWTAYSAWNYNWQVAKVVVWWTTYLLALPVITSSDVSTSTTVEDMVTNNKLVYKGYSNLPSNNVWTTFKVEWSPDLKLVNVANLVVYSGTDLPATWSEVISFMTNLKQAYTWTDLATDPNFTELVNLDLEDSVAISNMWWTMMKEILLEELDITRPCWTTKHGKTKDFWNISTVIYAQWQWVCDWAKKTFLCNDTEWKDWSEIADTVTYQYESCWVEPWLNCTSDATYLKNGHTYNVIQLNHNASSQPFVDVVENDGTFRYTLDITCLDSTLSSTETWPVVQSCDTNHTINWNTCLGNECSAQAQVVNGHTYNVPLILNWWTSNVTSQLFAITNGQATYNQTFWCPSWVFTTNWPENTLTVTQCWTDYYSSNSTTCIAVWTWYYSNSTATTRAACTNKPANSEYTGDWGWSNNCPYSCTGWYSWASCTIEPFLVTGWSVTDVWGYRIHKFTNGGTLNVSGNGNVDILLVAGGGGGGCAYISGWWWWWAGGVLFIQNTPVSVGDYVITVGNGGGRSNFRWNTGGMGGNSIIKKDNITIHEAFGGGWGGSWWPAWVNGGSGGGPGGSGTPGQGHNGGSNGWGWAGGHSSGVDGGIGRNFSTYFGTGVGEAGWFGGGGGSHGAFGGQGWGADSSGSSPPNTGWGWWSGADPYNGRCLHGTKASGKGGSGIAIVRYITP